MKKYLIIPFLGCLLYATNSFSQQYNFTNYSVTEGLAQSQVPSILEDSRGYLWLGTKGGGLCRFDGKNFSIFTIQNGLSSNYINALFEDKNDLLWISTANGINQYQNEEFTNFKTFSDGTVVNDFIQEKSEKIWLATNKGLYYIDNESNIKLFESKAFSDQYAITTIYQDEEESIWIGASNGLFKIEDGIFKEIKQADNGSYKDIRRIISTKDGVLWIASYNQGILLSDGDKILRQLTRRDGLTSTKIQTLNKDENGNIWIGTNDRGINIWYSKNQKFTTLTTHQGLVNNNVNTIIEDSWGNIWIGTSGGGVSKYSGQQFEHFTKNEGLKGNYINALEKDKQGQIWVATSSNGIQIYKGDKFIHFGDNSTLNNTSCKAIFEDRLGHIWFGTIDNGLTVFLDSLFLTFTIETGLAGNFINKITQDTLGNLWISSESSGITKIAWNDTIPSNSIFTTFTTDNGLPTNRINDLHIDNKNRIWVATKGGGIALIEQDKITKKLTIETGLLENEIRSFSEDSLGYLWYGTASYGLGNIKLYDKNFPINNGYKNLTSNNVKLIQIDELNNIWVGSETGLDYLKLDEVRNIVSKEHYGKIEGFRGIETNQNVVLQDKEKNLWFGTVNGLTKYNHSVQKGKAYPPKIYLKNAKLGERDFKETPYENWLKEWISLNLTYDQNELSFVVEALHLSYPDALLYEWKLADKDTQWSSPNANATTYQRTFLPGTYNLKVRAKTANGNSYSSTLEFPFTIASPFWQTWWFRVAAGSLTLLLISLFVKWRTSIIQKRAKRIQSRLELDKKLLELEQKALQLQMNPHFIFNALNSIQGSITPTDINTARLQLAKFSKLMRATLENARTETITLEEEIGTLSNYLSLEQFSRGDTFDYEIEVADSIDPELVNLPSMILQPFIENAIIHGVAHLEKRGKIKVEFARKGKRLSCKIEDNGIGRARAKELKSQIKVGHQSAALDITRERLDLLRSGKAMKNSLQIFDLKDAMGNACGTRVEVIIPIEEN